MWYIPVFPLRTDVTIDEELTSLEENVRRLKVEYDIYFGGGSRRAPTDLDWRVQGMIKKYSDSHKLSMRAALQVQRRGATLCYLTAICGGKSSELGKRVIGVLRTRCSAYRGCGRWQADAPTREDKSSAVLLFAGRATRRRAYGSYTRRFRARRSKGKAGGTLEAFTAFLRAKTKEIQNTLRMLRRQVHCRSEERTGADQGQAEF